MTFTRKSQTVKIIIIFLACVLLGILHALYTKAQTWVEVSSYIIRWYVPSLGVLVGDTLLPVRQIPVVPVQISTVKLWTTVPHVVEGVYTVVWGLQVGHVVQRASSTLLGGM